MTYAKLKIGCSVIAVALIFFGAFFPSFLHAATLQSDAGVNVKLVVPGCNNNGICEADLGEDQINCSLDCGSTPPSPTVTLVADPTTINSGNSSLLTWSSTNTTGCSASWTASTATAGSQSVSPTITTTYDIACTGPGGTANDSATVAVVAPGVPTVSLAANPTTINSGNSSLLTWSSTNTTACSASWTPSTTTSGSQSVSPSITTTYNIACTGPSGTAYDSATVIVVPTTNPSGPPSNGGGPTGFYSRLSITSLSVSSDYQSAVVNWSSNNTSLSIFSWGASPDFEMGSLSDVFFITHHQINIPNLKSGTRYYFKISARDLYGHLLIYLGEFNTLSIPHVVTLPNVRDLAIVPDHDGAIASWHNPAVPEFSGVVVVRSPYAYPRDPQNGKIIYDGQGNYVTDLSLQKNTIYYYSVFVYDAHRNYSSGSIAKFVSYPAQPNGGEVLQPSLFTLKLNDLDFIQNNRSSTFSLPFVEVVADQNLTVSISAGRLPGLIQTGTIQVTDPSNDISSAYLFSFNSDRNAYEAEVNLLGVAGGIFPFTVDLQFATSGESVLTSSMEVTKLKNGNDSGQKSASEFYLNIGILLLIILLLILIGLVLYHIYKRFLSDKNKNT